MNSFAGHAKLTNEEVAAKARYVQIGVEQSTFTKARNAEYERKRAEGLILPVRVNRIVTMDNPLFCPVRYVPAADASRNLPVIANTFNVSQEYMLLLGSMARIAGTDPDLVGPRNLVRMIEHQKYVPKRYWYSEAPQIA